MEKVIIIILILYVLYYAINIIYDLFFKKSVLVKNFKEEEKQLLFSNLDDENLIKNTTIEEAEEIQTPSSFHYDERNLFSYQEPTNLEEELEKLKEQYEEETAFQKIEIENEITEEQTEKKKILDKFSSNNLKGIINAEKIKNSPNLSEKQFYNLFSKSTNHYVVKEETNVQIKTTIPAEAI